MIGNCIVDGLVDAIKLVPFLFVTYVIMEWLEHKTGKAQEEKIRKAGAVGPLAGGALGIVPQCGFSVVAANLYTGGIISVGTILAVFMSTSDEMLPIFISKAVNSMTIIKILVFKAGIAIVTGFLVDGIIKLIGYREKHHREIHEICDEEHCHDKEGVWISAAKHTIKITMFIFVLTAALNIIIEIAGEDAVRTIFSDTPVLGEAAAALVGLIPNCSASVIITELYLEGMLNAGAMMSGLIVGAGVGLLVLFRMNRYHMKENIKILGLLYFFGFAWGVIINLAGITF
jgi:hypothetical protein